MFADLLFKRFLAWLDDMLGYAETPEDRLDQVLTICSSFGLKLNPKKCDLFLTNAVWCGKAFEVGRPALPHKNPRTVCARATHHDSRPPTVRVRDQLDAVQHPLLHRACGAAPPTPRRSDQVNWKFEEDEAHPRPTHCRWLGRWPSALLRQDQGSSLDDGSHGAPAGRHDGLPLHRRK
ncbi:hypothetical protein AaE_010013 [Aphanomyces astaci]|uniref:Reverse transcriptase domain-containing protein n=1 Tax=Aphanomyces astaci TaxID=112090 RepID=A0A6A5A3I5_APHAT|nr:hypothetical protein AaE_010013 [Aphanomyces astaci]